MPAPDGASGLTGRMRYRESFWRSVLVKQVEAIDHRRRQLKDPVPHYWRDATRDDLRAIEYLEGLTDEQRRDRYARSLG